LPPGTAVSEPGISDDSPPYTLGAGDIVRLDSFDTQEIVFEQRYTILLDGTLNLPWIGSISVQGLTLEQAGAKISDRYREFVRNPRMTISLVAPRPLKVGVIGEVNRPGSYIISVISNEITQASLNQRSSAEGGNQWPTVSKALQTAGGITQGASIRTIKVRRILPSGEERLLDVDLWKFLQEGDLDQDRLLRDGDAIIVSRAETLDAAEATQVAQSNFSPAEIRVSVVGEVLNPGTIALRPNTTLNQAILTAGGFRPVRARKVDVELIRLNPNGSVSRRNYKIDLSRGLDDTVNPPLHNNDVVVVNRTGIAKIADTLGVVLTPLSGVFSLFTILGLSRN
jgi:polysaccharide export outer membrane protein